MVETPYQQAVKQWGKETVDKLSRRAVDPETGYIARHLNELGVTDQGARCRRCGGRGMWEAPDNNGVLCLKCHDEWFESDLLEKHGYVWSRKKWRVAFEEFCQTTPSSVDIKAHNREITQGDSAIRALLPEYFR